MTTMHPRPANHRPKPFVGELNLVSLAVLFTCCVAIALVLVGVVRSGTAPVFVVFPTLVSVWAILTLRR
jgi:hypothetical protein